MRRFVLKNSLGQVMDLNREEHFLFNPSGLGQQHDVRYESVGNLFIKTDDILSQKSIGGKIRFASYQEFRLFSLFIQHKPLTLEYTSQDTYSMDVSIDRLDKSELETLGVVSSIRMKGLSPWYKTIYGENIEGGGSGKKYDYSYPYQYNEFATGEIVLESESALQSPCRIIIMGPCKNPAWTHYLNGKKMISGKIGTEEQPCHIAAGNRLIIDDTTKNYSIKEYDADGNEVMDLYPLSDFATQRFLYLGYGRNRLTYQHEDNNRLNVILEGRIYYESI